MPFSSQVNTLQQAVLKANTAFADPHLTIHNPMLLKAPVPRAEVVVFLHNPGTGGTTVGQAIQAAEAFQAKNPFSGESVSINTLRFAVPRIAGRSPNLFTEGSEGGLVSARGKLQSDLPDPHACDAYNVFTGHFPFGLHTLMPHRKMRYVAAVGDPEKLALRAVTFDVQRGFVDEADALNYLLTASVDNLQTRLLAGQMTGPCTLQTLEQAKQNVEKHFLLLGVAEDTDTLIEVLFTIQGWAPVATCQTQITGKKIIETIPREFVSEFEKKIGIDRQLYTWAKERWEKWKGAHIQAVVPFDDLTTSLPCVTWDFTARKAPREPDILTVEQIQRYNASLGSKKMLAVTQAHTAVPGEKPVVFSKEMILKRPRM